MGKLGLILGGAVLGLGFASPSFSAATALSIYSVTDHSLGPQSESAPCIIAGTTCQNGDFDYTNFVQSGAISAYDELSPLYTIADFPFLTFDVAMDVNTTNEAGETLLDFEVFVNGVLQYYFYDDTNVGGIANNGNGYGDWGLTLIDLSGFADTDTVQFRANFNGASDGAESFFIVERAAPPPVPLPGTLGLLGLGLAGLGMLRRKQTA